MISLRPPSPGEVDRVARLTLTSDSAPWTFAGQHAAAIGAHWQRRTQENPSFFNGQILVLRALRGGSDGFEGHLSLERFAAFLFWRDGVQSDPDVWDGFVSALVRSRQGDVVLGLNAAGTLSGGRMGLPGGFLDANDIRPDGSVDVVGAAAREFSEETGFDASLLRRVPGYLVARHGRYCAFGVEFRVDLDTSELQQRLAEGLNRGAAAELEAINILTERSDLDALHMLDHARLLVRHVFGHAG
ncbi:MAG: NUDIX hydrolase [Hyphomicrobiaceae bacterium]